MQKECHDGKEQVRREVFGKAVTDNPHGNGNSESSRTTS